MNSTLTPFTSYVPGVADGMGSSSDTTSLFSTTAATTIPAHMNTTQMPFSTAQTGMSTDLNSTVASFSSEVTTGDFFGQTATAGLAQQDLSPAMLSRIPTIVMAVYIVNSVLANYRSTAQDRFPSLPGLTPSHQRRGVELQGVEINPRLKLSKIFEPRKFHLREKNLFKKLGEDFDPSWMSVEQPPDFLKVSVNDERDPEIADEWIRSVNPWALIKSLNALNITQYGSLDVNIQHASKNQRMDNAVKMVMSVLQDWLVQKATCPVRFIWEDMGKLFWPRYIRKGYCSKGNIPEKVQKRVSSSLADTPLIEQDCSWPPGMICVPGEEKRLRMLFWKCVPRRAVRKRQGTRSSDSLPTKSDLRSDMPAVGSTKGSFQRALESVGTGRRFAAVSRSPTRGSLKSSRETTMNDAINKPEDGSQISADIQDLSSIMSKIKSHRQKRSTTIPKEMVGYISSHSLPQRDEAPAGNVPEPEAKEDYSKLSWKELRKKFKVKCRWQKITLPVTEYCHCSC